MIDDGMGYYNPAMLNRLFYGPDATRGAFFKRSQKERRKMKRRGGK